MPQPRFGNMRHLRHTSYGMTVFGVGTLGAASAFDLGATIQLIGLLLAWAGVVKIIVVHLWTHVAHLGTDRHDPVPPT